MTKNALALCVVLCTNSLSAMALEPMAEEEMSGLSAQDGVTMLFSLPLSGWRANEMSLTDTNGISSAIASGYGSPGTVAATKVGVNTCLELLGGGACTSIIGGSIKLDIDMVGDSNGVAADGSMLNMAFSLTGGANKMRFYIDDIRLRNGQSGGTEFVLVDFLQNYIDIVPIGSKSLFSLQLGTDTLGHMIHFTNGKFGTIDFGVVSFLERTNANNSLRFGFKLDNVDLTGTGFDVNPTGLIYTASNFGGGTMNATFSNITMGGASAASIGTIGLQGISVTNLAVTVAGKL